jgi:hypothetical protein
MFILSSFQHGEPLARLSIQNTFLITSHQADLFVDPLSVTLTKRIVVRSRVWFLFYFCLYTSRECARVGPPLRIACRFVVRTAGLYVQLRPGLLCTIVLVFFFLYAQAWET